jgi:putative endonuclease
MAQHNALGTDGEKLAAHYLVEKGYSILETNWRFGKKEIDIIAQIGNTIAVVEVKTRSTDYFGDPEESVTLSKQKYLIEAADEYLQSLDFDAEVRFDIISIIKANSKLSIHHIEEAFIPLAE